MGPEKNDWGTEEVNKVLKVLRPCQPLVSDARLREEIAAIPKYLENGLSSDNTRLRQYYSAYRKFAKYWPLLSTEVQEIISQSYGVDVRWGQQGVAEIVSWLQDNLTEEYGRNDIEKRQLRPIINSLDGFPKQPSWLCFLGESYHQFRWPEIEDNSSSFMNVLECIVHAANVLGKEDISKKQQKQCDRLCRVWRAESYAKQIQIAASLEPFIQEPVTYEDVATHLIDLSSHGSELPPKLIECFQGLEPKTFIQIGRETVCRLLFPYVVAQPGPKRCAIHSAIGSLAETAGYLGASIEVSRGGYQKGRFNATMVQAASWLMVLAGHSKLSATDTGPLAKLLTEMDRLLSDGNPRVSWRDMIEQVLGGEAKRTNRVEYLKSVTDERSLDDPSLPPPETWVVKIKTGIPMY